LGEKLSINPITRIEGHLGVKVEIESNRIVDAQSSGEMFRGFEVILKGRDPLDAQQITQRICGVCPVSHGVASSLAQEQAYSVNPPSNGRLLRNLILASNYIQSHILHFYQLAAVDFIDIKAITLYQGNDPLLNGLKSWAEQQISSTTAFPLAPFLPRYPGQYLESAELNILAIKHYLEALDMRRQAHKACALFAGKMPHAATLIPGGVTERVTVSKIVAFQEILKQLRIFIDNAYLPDALEVVKGFPDYFEIGKGPGNFLAYGVFPESDDGAKLLFPSGVVMDGKAGPFDADKITEDVQYSRYSSPSNLPPGQGQTVPDHAKPNAYSWLKAPRYEGKVMEVGPLARLLVAYHRDQGGAIKSQVDAALSILGKTPADLNSTSGRHVARALECKIVADRCAEWIAEVSPDGAAFKDFTIPQQASGVGLTEAPRGALGHWLKIEEKKIGSYQCVVPTTWNCSPRDDKGNLGAVEQALIGVPVQDSKNPIEAVRVVRSFDPCIACAVH